ncbi:hypothetical protein SmJEL517_g02531 [Synchytrium microbalum]|uniref:Uncharacterized protein n=1 Tax=Synchytrium microbalum TaxID=1806994 RepID=A0A507BZV7_9FUNG|nr:uncharacterized protein SmJEL517_g02531 [Synchytrium microbalum]TPX34810.1 hypothetical protein SmJEL517_g02531 [Synchytrium microbalum]
MQGLRWMQSTKKLLTGPVYVDRVYGTVKIPGHIQKLVNNSLALCRLSKVYQAGTGVLLNHFGHDDDQRPVDRLEHSIGVALLVERLGGDDHQQVGFDFDVRSMDEDSWHEINVEEFVNKTDLPTFFTQDELSSLLHLSHHTLVEQPTPLMCADRIDYFLRDVIALRVDCHQIGLTDDTSRSIWVGRFIKSLTVAANDDGVTIMVTTDRDLANEAAILFMKLNDDVYISAQSVGVYHLTAKLLHRALDLEILCEDDFDSRGDEEVWRMVEEGVARDVEMSQLWEILHSAKTEYKLCLGNASEEGRWKSLASDVSLRMRYVDPSVLVDGRIQPASALNGDLKQRLIAYKAKGMNKVNVMYRSG